MILLTSPFYKRMLHIIYIGISILFLSCQSDPIMHNPSSGYEYYNKQFLINSQSSKTIQGELHTGYSPRLYSGILFNGDTVSTLIRFSSEVIDSHQVCNADSINAFAILLNTISPIALMENGVIIDTLIEYEALKSYIISTEDFEEDYIMSDDKIDNILSLTNSAIPISIDIDISTLKLNLFNQDSLVINKLCQENDNLEIIISYTPSDSSFLEFYSSNNVNVGLGPKLSVNYFSNESKSINFMRYTINQVSWSEGIMHDEISGPYFVKDSLSEYWGTVYAMNLNKGDQLIYNPPLAYDSVSFLSDITLNSQNSSLILMELDINDKILSDTASILFSLGNSFAFISASDPAGDNWSADYNPDSTEADGFYTVGEKFNDYGFDNCPSEWETGNSLNPCDSLLSIYNIIGTEGNGQLDWVDQNENNLWDDGEGEKWIDWGIDGCIDKYESGTGTCLFDDNGDWVLNDSWVDGQGMDFNADNYNIDPFGDDWNMETKPDSSEGNGTYNLGEPFNDWGSDGLYWTLIGIKDEDGTEGNGIYDLGEPFDDTGTDGKFNIDEQGYNADGSEGNNIFDYAGEFFDCGLDNVCLTDSIIDDYNIDPNNDNWIEGDTTSLLTEGNNQFDDGEEWFDWGLDGIPDSLEAFQGSLVIPILKYDNSYNFNLAENVYSFNPELQTDTVSLWISEIKKVENKLLLEISVSSNVALKGLQFQLYHTPFIETDTVLEVYSSEISQVNGDKIFYDFSLHPKKIFSDQEVESINDSGKLFLDYSNDIFSFLDFDSLNFFIENKEYIFSTEYSNLVFNIDKLNSYIDSDGLWIYLSNSESENNEVLTTRFVSSWEDSVQIPIGKILREFQMESSSSYNGLDIRLSNELYNYSNLSIINPRINIIYTK